MRKSLAIVAVGVSALFASAAIAQTSSSTTGMRSSSGSMSSMSDSGAAANQAESRNYDRMTRDSAGFRNDRMRRECSPIEAADLRQACMDSFGPASATTASRREDTGASKRAAPASTTRRDDARTMSGASGNNRTTAMGASPAPGTRPMSSEVQGQSSTGIGSALPQTNYGGNRSNSNNR